MFKPSPVSHWKVTVGGGCDCWIVCSEAAENVGHRALNSKTGAVWWEVVSAAVQQGDSPDQSL